LAKAAVSYFFPGGKKGMGRGRLGGDRRLVSRKCVQAIMFGAKAGSRHRRNVRFGHNYIRDKAGTVSKYRIQDRKRIGSGLRVGISLTCCICAMLKFDLFHVALRASLSSYGINECRRRFARMQKVSV
jgi:hypothetical protein